MVIFPVISRSNLPYLFLFFFLMRLKSDHLYNTLSSVKRPARVQFHKSPAINRPPVSKKRRVKQYLFFRSLLSCYSWQRMTIHHFLSANISDIHGIALSKVRQVTVSTEVVRLPQVQYCAN